jgi:hypothetical protein
VPELQREIWEWPTLFCAPRVVQIPQFGSEYGPDMALKKHKINSAKKSESKRKDVAMRRELAAKGKQNRETPVEALSDPQDTWTTKHYS